MHNFDPKKIREDFPILNKMVNGKRLAYLDNGATTQKPKQVINSIRDYNLSSHGNPHRGAHQLSIKATQEYDLAKETVKVFINAKSIEEIIFTKGATESLNLLALSYGMENVKENEEIVITPEPEEPGEETVVIDEPDEEDADPADVSGNEESENDVSTPETEETVYEITVSGNTFASETTSEGSVQAADYTEILTDIHNSINDLNLLVGIVLFVLIATWTDRHFASIVNKFSGKGRD